MAIHMLFPNHFINKSPASGVHGISDPIRAIVGAIPRWVEHFNGKHIDERTAGLFQRFLLDSLEPVGMDQSFGVTEWYWFKPTTLPD